MTKHIQHVVPESQQKITTTVEREDDELEVKIIACSALDDELRSEFHSKIQSLDSDAVTVRSERYRSNQGNELHQDVFVSFAKEDQMKAIDIVNEIVQIGKEYYDKQLERNLGNEEGPSDYYYRNQQRYFDDDEVKEFCLLYRGAVQF